MSIVKLAGAALLTLPLLTACGSDDRPQAASVSSGSYSQQQSAVTTRDEASERIYSRSLRK